MPVALDETAHLVNSRSSVTVTPDAEGYFEAVLWAGAWRAEFADGTSFPFPVVAGTSERLVDLRGYVPPPGTTVQVVALAGVDVETLEPDDPATGEWRVDRLKLGLPRGNQGDKGDAATISVGSTTSGAPGTPADVTNSGDSHNAVFHFTIPAGHDGREVEFGLSATHVQWRYVGDVAWMDLIALSSLAGRTDTGYIEVQGKLLNGWAQSGTRHVTLRRVGDLVTLAGMLVSPPVRGHHQTRTDTGAADQLLPCQPPSPPEHPLPRGDDPMGPAASRLPRLRR